MAGLIDKKKLDRAKRLKEKRTRLIREAALRAFMSFPYVDVTLESIGKLAGVAQGKAELYFHSREQLFLEVFATEVEAWYTDLEERLEPPPVALSREQAVEEIFASLEGRPELLRLLGLLHVVLDQNLDMVDGVIFVRRLKQSMERCARSFEARCEWMAEGAGFKMLNRLQNYMSSLYSVSHPTGSFAMMVQDRDLVGFQVDFEAELKLLIAKVVD